MASLSKCTGATYAATELLRACVQPGHAASNCIANDSDVTVVPLLLDAIAEWHRNAGPESWQVAEALKRLGRIERERGSLEQAAARFRQALQTYDAAGIRGYGYLDLQARSEFATILRKLGRGKEAESLETERREADAEHLKVIPEIVRKIYSGAPTLGLATEK